MINEVLLWNHKVGPLLVVELLDKFAVSLVEILGALDIVALQVYLVVLRPVLLLILPVLFLYLILVIMWLAHLGVGEVGLGQLEPLLCLLDRTFLLLKEVFVACWL